MSSEERRGATAAADVWNERYARTRQVWSGEHNATLVAELEGVAPRRALDVGCGARAAARRAGE